MKYVCSECGGERTEFDTATLDERYPLVVCSDCKARRVGVRADVFDRKRWQQERADAQIEKARIKASKPPRKQKWPA
jgi:DNA-directed RNA polymerase subunit RPC12/RpoP